ncbi:PilZ domain-containing protein [Synechococcus sp. CCY 9618]|uniref:PilZ domain-containing protein n=1 Tax=Synechococcus sp. CCY 9618 TaxID=2815602 RepID=UPI001C22131F|nr:PilZ domain-containing protein [Synechococcus sp. CCY 9618]
MQESRIPRREPRFSAPFFQILIKVEVYYPDHCYPGHIWDVSHSGACIRSFQKVPIGFPSQIRIRDPGDVEVIETSGELIWVNQLRGAHYSGVKFDESFDITKTFLRLLIKSEQF